MSINTEQKICQNCKNPFTIEPEDFEFYQKIHVPAPTFCPECRFIRRISWRNERSLYKRKCDLCDKEVISIYHTQSPSRVYCQDCWWSDKWDPMMFGKNYDFSISFFEQFYGLVTSVPQMSLINKQAVNSPYGHSTVGNKNCYMVFGGDYNEDCMYSTFNFYCKDSSDLYWIFKSERSYELIDSRRCFDVAFGQYCENCFDSRILYDCKNCNNCFGCVGLRNKSYCIFNKQYTPESYQEKMKEFNAASYPELQKIFVEFRALILKFPHKYAIIEQSKNCTGNQIMHSKNCFQCFDVENDIEDARHLWLAFGGPKDLNSICHVSTGTELCYDSCSLVEDARIFFSKKIWNQSRDVYYSYNCHNSSNIFGCVSLRGKQYCIFNKQYTPEEYENLTARIRKQMEDVPFRDKAGRIYKFGEFFPTEFSPFAYNETVAQEYFPLTKERAIELGYKWKDPEEKHYTVTISHGKLPDNIRDVPDSITNEIIGCAHGGKCGEQCSFAFKIIPQELKFYRSMGVPLPRLCSNCRHYQRIKQRNPLKLWHRTCQCVGRKSEIRSTKSETPIYENTATHIHGEHPCPNEFETSYAPERPEIVYCEACYNSEVV